MVSKQQIKIFAGLAIVALALGFIMAFTSSQSSGDKLMDQEEAIAYGQAAKASQEYELTTSLPDDLVGYAVKHFEDKGVSSDNYDLILNTYNDIFSAITESVSPSEFITLLDYSQNVNEFYSGKATLDTSKVSKANNIAKKYGIVETDGIIDDTIYGDIVLASNLYRVDMEDDPESIWEDTVGLPELELNENYPEAEINGVRACYQYTGETANLDIYVAETEEGTVNNVPAEYAVYDDYEDCLRGNTNIAKEFTNGFSRKLDNSKGQANGEVSPTDREVSETVLVETGDFISMYNARAELRGEITDGTTTD